MSFMDISPFHIAVLVNERHIQNVRWHSTSKFASCVLVGMNRPAASEDATNEQGATHHWLVINAYLPQPGRGNHIFLEDITDVLNLIQSVPKSFGKPLTFLGCDANVGVAPHDGLQHLIGANALGEFADERSDYFLSLVLELQLCVANTFGPYCPEWGWTHEWYGDKRPKNQIDFVLVPPSLVHNTSVLYRIDCASDHKPVCCYVDTPAPSPPPPARKRSLRVETEEP